MTAKPVWSGDIDATNPEGARTGINLKAGQLFTVGASGWVKRGKEDYTLAGPQGVAGKTDGSVVLKGRIGGKEFVVGNYLVDFPAPAEGELTLYVSDGATKYGDNSGTFQASVFLPQSRFDNLTDFSNGSLNGWATGDAINASTNKTLLEGGVLKIMTYPGEKNAGTVISKKVSGLKKGQVYDFSAEVTRIIGKYKEPRLSLRVDGKDVTPVINLTTANLWFTLGARFTANSDTAELSVVSHESDSMGNDYQIKTLRIFS